MKLLVILPGTPVSKVTAEEKECVSLQTLTKGKQLFLKTELVNNLQSIAGLQAAATVDITIRSFSQRKNPWRLIKAGKAIRSLVVNEKFDGVYVFWGGISAWIVTQYSFAPVVVCLLGSDLMGSYTVDGKKTSFGKLLAFFSRQACKEAKGIVVMSEKMKQRLAPTQQQKTLVLPEGVDLEKFYPKDKQECRKLLGWREEENVVLFFNSGAFVKNAPLANAAFQLLKVKEPNASLVEVKNVPHHELINYYNAADLLLLTSFHEGSNNSIKEALACNCPVVSTDAGDANDRLDGVIPSYCIKDFDAAMLAEKMAEILHNPQRCNGREKVASVSIERVGKQLSEYLHKVIPASGKSHQ
jgi:glycosyltransferase involved in cell wall biosynthesis